MKPIVTLCFCLLGLTVSQMDEDRQIQVLLTQLGTSQAELPALVDTYLASNGQLKGILRPQPPPRNDTRVNSTDNRMRFVKTGGQVVMNKRIYMDN